MSDETKEIIDSQMNDMRKELADVHTNVGMILQCLDTMNRVLNTGVKNNGLQPDEVATLIELHDSIYNHAKRC